MVSHLPASADYRKERQWRRSRMTDDGLTCHEVLDLLTEYLEGALVPVEHARVAAHLELCEGCARFLEQLTLTIAVTGALREDAVPDDVRDSLVAAFRTWRRPNA
jgi:predicted anti-sigma-YlaC factor YlaD